MSNENEKVLVDPMSFKPGSEFSDQKPEKTFGVDMIPDKDVEKKTYILLLKLEDYITDLETDECGIFVVCEGRTAAYRMIENYLQRYGASVFNVYDSRILTETKQTNSKTNKREYFMINYDKAISVYGFCKTVEGFYGKMGFSIDEYVDDSEAYEGSELEAEDNEVASEDDEAMNYFKAHATDEVGQVPLDYDGEGQNV
jgi:hypothetical protein